MMTFIDTMDRASNAGRRKSQVASPGRPRDPMSITVSARLTSTTRRMIAADLILATLSREWACHPLAFGPIQSVATHDERAQVDAVEDQMSAVPIPSAVARGGDSHEISTELSARRTGMSFQRTRMSADRTLMSVIRTGLSLISFGFTIYQFFERLTDQGLLRGSHAPRNFGAALVYLGVGMVAVGIAFHIQFMRSLRQQRQDMKEEGLIHAESRFPVSYTLVVAILLLVLGLAAIASLTFHAGPLN